MTAVMATPFLNNDSIIASGQRPDKRFLTTVARAGAFPVPKQCEIHVGADDWQSNPANVKAFGTMVGVAVTVVPDAGHSLPKAYVGGLLDRWTKTLI